jgi:tetratricopeptide (TPR) repeat protein
VKNKVWMQIELRSRVGRFFFAAVCLLAIGAYIQLALRAFLAAHFASTLEASHLKAAIQLEPDNADYYDLLGRNFALSGPSLNQAITNYQAAVRLNPYQARYWLDLAGAYQIAGRTQEQGESVEKAASAEPTAPQVAWEAANFFITQGDFDRALRYFRVVMANDTDAVDAALLLCWRATGDVQKIVDQALPPIPQVYLSLLRLLIGKQDTVGAETVWNRLIGLRKPFSAKLSLPYFRLLIAKQEPSEAKTAWEQLSHIDPSIKAYQPSRENMVVNGGFEQNMLNGGFDWWYNTYPQAVLAIDTTEFRSGSRSLSVTFDGHSVPGAPILQYVPVKPDTSYEFRAESRSEDIDTASGPRFAVVDAYTNFSYVLTDDTLGTTPWRPQRARFRTGPDTNLLLLQIVRDPPQPHIRGKFWIDDVSLIEVVDQGS